MPTPSTSEDTPDVSRKVEEGVCSCAAVFLAGAFCPIALSLLFNLLPPPSLLASPALLFQLKQRAYSVCSAAAGAYADCCRGRTFSMAWACRTELRALSTCLGEQLS